MSKAVKRKITVSVSPKPKNLTKSRPSVFERLGTKTGTSSLHKEYCHHWSQSGTCPFGKNCKYSSTHTLISPSKQRAAKKESESKKRHTKDNAHKRLPPAPGDEEWDNWDPAELAEADPDDLEKRRQELQRELEIQLKMDTKARKKDKKTKQESSPSESSSSSDTSSSTDESSSTSSSSVEARKKKAKKMKKHDSSSSSECDRKKPKSMKAASKHPGSTKIKAKTDKVKKLTPVGKPKIVGAISPTPIKPIRKESRTPPLKAKSIPTMRKKSTSISPRSLSRDKKEKHRSPSPRERDNRDKERDREREQRERDKEKERLLEREREKERLKTKDSRDKDVLKKKERSPKRVDDRKRRDSPERKVSPSRSRGSVNGSSAGRRDVHKSPTRDDKRHCGSDNALAPRRGTGKDTGNLSSSSDKQQRGKDTATKRDNSRDDRERQREQLREQREQRERERRIAREEREAAREKEREEALARCQERQRERERIKAEQLRKAAEEELKRKEMQLQRRRDDARDRGLDKPSSDRIERLLPLPADRLTSVSRKSSMDRDRLVGRERDRRDRSPISNRSGSRKSLDRGHGHESGPRLDHHHRKEQDYDSRDHRGSDRSDPGRDYPMRIMDEREREQSRHHRIEDVGKQGRYGSPYDGGRSRSHVDDRRAGYGEHYGDNSREMRLPPSLLDHHASSSDEHRRGRSRERDRDHWDDHQLDRDRDRDIESQQRRHPHRGDDSRPPIQPLVTIGGPGSTGGPPQQQQWPSQTGPGGSTSGEFGLVPNEAPAAQQMQAVQHGASQMDEEWGEHQQSRCIGPRSSRPLPLDWDPATSRGRDWDREQSMQQQGNQPPLDQQHSVNIGHFPGTGGANRGGGGAQDNWQQGADGTGVGGDEAHGSGGRGNRRWFGRDDWRDRERSDRDKGRAGGVNVNVQRDDSHQDRRKDNVVKQELEGVRPSTLLSVPLEPVDGIKKETLPTLKRPAEQSSENTADAKKPCLAPEEPLADDLSEISDDADEILNRDEEILKDEIAETPTDPAVLPSNESHPSPALSQIPEEMKDQKSLLSSITPHSPVKRNQLVSTPQRSASPIRSMKGESVPDDDHMVDNTTMDFEEISEDELEEETRVKGLGDALGVDWASLVAESRPRVKPVTSAKRRWEPHNVLINLGVSVEYAGEDLVKKIFQLHHQEKLKLEKEENNKRPSNSIASPVKEASGDTPQASNKDSAKTIKQEIVDLNGEVTTIKEEPLDVANTSLEEEVTVKTEPADTKENTVPEELKADVEKTEAEVEISHPVAFIQVAMRNKIAIRKSLFASAGPYRRALSARRDLAIRRHLCNLPISDTYVEAPRRHDPEMFRTAMELFAKCL